MMGETGELHKFSNQDVCVCHVRTVAFVMASYSSNLMTSIRMITIFFVLLLFVIHKNRYSSLNRIFIAESDSMQYVT